MQEVELSGGRIRYRDHGEGRPIVFVHGVFVNSALWRKVEPPLVAAGFRCVAPDWPLGAHIAPMSADADVTPRGVARLIGEFLDRLDLSDVTLVANDTGGAIAQLLLAEGCDRVARVVLTPCDSFDNFLPPSIRGLQYLARVPGAVKLGAQILRSGRLRRLVFRTLAKRPIPDDVTASWVRPMLTNREIRRDTARFLSAIDHRDTAAAAERLRGFARPVLLLWPRKAPYFPFSHAERWNELLPDARLIEVDDSYTFLSEDQPALLVRELTAFITAASKPARTNRKGATR
jgi:pimeloyl-ACP methyl ester carboxylesterase